MSIITHFAKSWAKIECCVHTNEELLSWITELNKNTYVHIEKVALEKDNFWFIDPEHGVLRNKNNSFFSIQGCILKTPDSLKEQPIIIQDEIGYLGIICKVIDGILYFLMQAKIEPGNINKIQLSPTIQATKSNFTQLHGGNKPAYLDYFLQAEKYEIIVDQIQSEQSSRFYKKRNRNIIICIKDEIQLLPNFKWFTLGQLKNFMEMDNLVNMDTRTVLSCIPFSVHQLESEELKEISAFFEEQDLYRSIFTQNNTNFLPQIYRKINNYKMFSEQKKQLVPLSQLKKWSMINHEFVCSESYPFKLIFCDIEIEGREVKKWSQPLFEAMGIATFGLFITECNGRWLFLVKLSSEIGCMDEVELGPTVQLEATESFDHDIITRLFEQKMDRKENILHDVLLSEEGGRFYHEQNHNVIIRINENDIPELPNEYLWVDFYTLNHLVQVNNCLNIQLRNLLSLLKVSYEKN